MGKEKSAVIFVNGIVPVPTRVAPLVKSAELLIAADGGLLHALTIGITPHILIGDLDSVTNDEISRVSESGGEIHRFPAEKDETDLELAVEYAIKSGVKRITLIGALGGRTDHLLANIMLLTDQRYAGLDMRLIDGQEELFLIREQGVVNGMVGDLVSLLPISESVLGVTTYGLRYPLKDAALFRWKTRGISNEMLSSTAEIWLRSGLLLCIHNTQNNNLQQEKDQ